MTQYRMQVSPDVVLTSRERIEKRIGRERTERFRAAEPLLALLEYRYREETETSSDCAYGFSRIFAFDSLLGKKPTTKAMADILAPVLYGTARIKYAFRKKAETRLAFSNAFLFSPRYPMVREQVERKYGCTAVITFYDLIKRSFPEETVQLKDSFRLDAGKVKPVFIPRASIAGHALQNAVMEYYQLMHRIAEGQRDDAALDAALTRLQEAYTRRVALLSRRLKKENVKQYITVNQYNLRDLLMIHACRDAGIETMQQEHNAMQFSRLPFDPEHPWARLAFARNYGFWTESEKRFHQMVYRYDNLLYPPDANRYIISGNTEMSYEQVTAYQKKYPEQRKVVFMSAAPGFDSQEEQAAYEEWRWRIFNGLRELSEKQKVPVTIRYTPFFEQVFREKEIPVLTSWGFTISESVPGNLMEDMCTGSIIMSSTSSVLSTARLLGKTVYRVEDPGITYVHVDDGILDIQAEDIAGLVIPEVTGSAADGIDPDGFFNIDKALVFK